MKRPVIVIKGVGNVLNLEDRARAFALLRELLIGMRALGYTPVIHADVVHIVRPDGSFAISVDRDGAEPGASFEDYRKAVQETWPGATA